MKRNSVLALLAVLLLALIVGTIGLGFAGWKLRKREASWN